MFKIFSNVLITTQRYLFILFKDFTPDSIDFNSELVKDCNVIILTYSIDSVDSFKNALLNWKPALDEQNVLCPIVLAGLLFYFYPKKRTNI